MVATCPSFSLSQSRASCGNLACHGGIGVSSITLSDFTTCARAAWMKLMFPLTI